jgi:Tol biopolymer transport system component
MALLTRRFRMLSAGAIALVSVPALVTHLTGADHIARWGSGIPPGDFNAALVRLIAAGNEPEPFASIRNQSSSNSSGQSGPARFEIPGAERCSVEQLSSVGTPATSYQYSCLSLYRKLGEAFPGYEELVDLISRGINGIVEPETSYGKSVKKVLIRSSRRPGLTFKISLEKDVQFEKNPNHFMVSLFLTADVQPGSRSTSGGLVSSESVAAVLQRIVSAAGEGVPFKSLRAAPNSNGNSWGAAAILPGASSCTVGMIAGTGRPSYSCLWVRRDGAEARAVYEGMTRFLGESPDWKPRPMQDADAASGIIQQLTFHTDLGLGVDFVIQLRGGTVFVLMGLVRTPVAEPSATISPVSVNDAPSVALQVSAPSFVLSHTLTGHDNWVRSVAFSPNGQLLASSGYDNTVKLWEVATGREVRTLLGHKDFVWPVAFSPDGRQVASGSKDGTVKLWEVATGQEVRTLTGHKDGIEALAFSPDGRLLASGAAVLDKSVKLWEVATGREVNSLMGHGNGISSVAFSPDGRLLASGSYDRTIELWETATGRPVRTLTGHAEYVSTVAFSPDGRTLASGSYDMNIRLWNVATGQTVRVLSGHSGYVMSVAFSSDGRWLASGSKDHTIKLWSPESGQAVRTITAHSDLVDCVQFSPDGNWLASAGFDKTVKLWHRVEESGR